MIFYSTIVMAAFQVIGGFIGAIDLRLAIYCSVPFVFLALVVSTRLTEPPVHSTSQASNNLRDQITEIYQTIRQDT